MALLFSVHTADIKISAEKRTINLPKPARVTDALTGEVISEKTDSFTVDCKQYETKMWWLE